MRSWSHHVPASRTPVTVTAKLTATGESASREAHQAQNGNQRGVHAEEDAFAVPRRALTRAVQQVRVQGGRVAGPGHFSMS